MHILGVGSCKCWSDSFFIVIFIKIVENMNEARDIEVHFATNNAMQWIHGATNVYVQN